jgi:hypothetical protein
MIPNGTIPFQYNTFYSVNLIFELFEGAQVR